MSETAFEISDRSEVSATSNYLDADLGEESVLLQTQSWVYYGLDPLGTRIWHFIKTPRAFHEIVKWVLANYDGVTEDACRQDLRILFQQMQDEGLVAIKHAQMV